MIKYVFQNLVIGVAVCVGIILLGTIGNVFSHEVTLLVSGILIGASITEIVSVSNRVQVSQPKPEQVIELQPSEVLAKPNRSHSQLQVNSTRIIGR